MISKKQGSLNKKHKFSYQSKQIKHVTHYKYLGFTFTISGSAMTGINTLITPWFTLSRELSGTVGNGRELLTSVGNGRERSGAVYRTFSISTTVPDCSRPLPTWEVPDASRLFPTAPDSVWTKLKQAQKAWFSIRHHLFQSKNKNIHTYQFLTPKSNLYCCTHAKHGHTLLRRNVT